MTELEPLADRLDTVKIGTFANVAHVSSDFLMFDQYRRIFDIDAEKPDRRFDLGMLEQSLCGTDVSDSF